MITNAQSNTRVDEVATRIYRISTPVTNIPGGFSFNRYLVVDDAPLLFHTGPRGMFPLTRDAIAAVIPVERLRYVGFSHFENDESGALNELLAVAPEALGGTPQTYPQTYLLLSPLGGLWTQGRASDVPLCPLVRLPP